MTTAATISARLTLDQKDFDRGLSSAEKRADSLQKKMKNIGGKMMKIGGAMTAGLTLPIAAAGVKMVGMASDMEESVSKVNVVFGESADAIQKWSETSATALGISRQEALEAAGTYGNLFQAMGLTTKEAVEMSKGTVGLAADLASFNNASPEDTLLALRSGLTGEMEPLKKFGIAMNQASLKAMSMTMGLGDNFTALDEASKMQVRYAVIMDQTTMAQGDFVRTSEGLANSTRIAQAQFADMAATLGSQLLPIGLKIVTFLSDLVAKFSALTPAQQKTILVILGVVAAIGPLVTIVGGLITAFGAVMPILAAVAAVLTGPVGLAIAAIVALVIALKLAWDNNFGGIQEKTRAVFAIIQKIFDAFKALFSGDFKAFGQLLREAWEMAMNFLSSIFSTHTEKIKKVFVDFVNKIIDFLKNPDWAGLGKSIIQGLARGILSAVGAVINAAAKIGNAIKDTVTGFFGINSDSKLMMKFGGNIGGGLISGFESVLGKGSNAMKSLLQGSPLAGGSANFAGGGARSSGPISVTIHNPAAEPATKSINREMKKLSYLGIIE